MQERSMFTRKLNYMCDFDVTSAGDSDAKDLHKDLHNLPVWLWTHDIASAGDSDAKDLHKDLHNLPVWHLQRPRSPFTPPLTEWVYTGVLDLQKKLVGSRAYTINYIPKGLSSPEFTQVSVIFRSCYSEVMTRITSRPHRFSFNQALTV